MIDILKIDPVAAEDSVRATCGAELDDVLDVRVRPEHADVISAIRRLDLAGEVGPFCVTLLFETRPRGLLDPAQLGADIVWVALLRRLAGHDPNTASLVARQLIVELGRLQFDGHEVCGGVEAVIRYALSVIESQRGRQHEVWRESYAASIAGFVEDDHRPGYGLAVVVRAAKLWAGFRT